MSKRPRTKSDRHRRYGFYGRKRDAPDTRQFMLIANGHVYGLHEEKVGRKPDQTKVGKLEVYRLDGRKVAESILRPGPPSEHLLHQGFGENFSYSCPMSIGTDCLYFADNRFLYCIGKGGG